MMCNFRLAILFLLMFFMAPCTKAQKGLHYSFRHINQSDGLLHNQVFSIVQDRKGFIWLETPKGLQRYDGSRFIYYPDIHTSPTEGLTVSDQMYIDQKTNLLWKLKNNTIKKMELDNNRLTYYDPEKLINDTSFHFVSYSGVGNTTWMLGNNTVYSVDNRTKKIISRQENILPRSTHRSSFIFSDSINKQTWVVLSKIFLFDEKTKIVYSSDFNPNKHPLLEYPIHVPGEFSPRYIFADSRNNIWITTWGERLIRYDPVLHKIRTYYLSDIKSKQRNKNVAAASLLITCILEDDHNNIWLGTENTGLLLFNRLKDNFDYCTNEENKSEDLQYNYKIFALFQDTEQNIWIGTDKGINIFNPYRQYFNVIRHDVNNPGSIPKSEIISFIQATNGDIFLGTWGNGMSIYDSNFNFKKNIIFRGATENNFIWDFQQINERTLWIGCQYGYLIEYDILTGSTKYLHPPEMEGFTIRCMEKDNQGNILFGLHNGKIVTWEKKKNKFLPFGNDSVKERHPVLNILIDPEQQCWVSTEAGFKEFDLNKHVYTSIWLPDKKNHKSISGKRILGIDVFDDSTLVIGLNSGGINLFNKRSKTFSALTNDKGLQSQAVYAIKKDPAGFIWFTTDYGLFKFNRVDKKIIPYNFDAGVITSSFNSARFYPLRDGQWLTLTTTEAISFDPQKTEFQKTLPPRTEITDFKIFDNPLFVDSLITGNKPIRLSFKENFFTVEYAALNFSSLQQITYHYRLSGTDKDWVNAGTKRFASYTDLRSGEYTFEVKAEMGNSIGKTTSFRIIITPPYWKTAWFRLLCLALIAGIIYSIAKWRINSIKNEGKRKMNFTRQMAEMEMKALRSQMNPHFIFNCINSIDALIQSNDKYHATLYLNKFAKLLRNILDSNKQNTVTFSKDIDTLKLYIELEELRHENKFKPVFTIDNELMNSDYKVPPLIVQPFVENAILHGLKNKEGNDGLLTIDILKVNDKIQYTISDNGIGRVAAGEIMQNKESHYGMQISYDRIKLFNKEENASVQITDLYTNGIPVGTEVKVNLNII